jgi:hypothetical protein
MRPTWLRLSLRELLLLMVIVALALGWWADRQYDSQLQTKYQMDAKLWEQRANMLKSTVERGALGGGKKEISWIPNDAVGLRVRYLTPLDEVEHGSSQTKK